MTQREDRHLSLLAIVLTLAMGLGLAGCAADSTPVDPANSTAPTTPDDRADNGQTGSLGPSECESDTVCRQSASASVEALTAAAASPGEVTGARCEYITVMPGDGSPPTAGTSCDCDIEGVGTRTLGPVGLGCYLTGRGGDCLASDADFDGCQEGQPDACQASCEHLRQRIAKDRARVFDAEIRQATCEANACQQVLDIDGTCYANGSERFGQGYDCALGADGVLAAWAADNRTLDESSDLLPNMSAYPPGTDAFFELSVNRRFEGTHALPEGFGVFSQFYWVEGEAGSRFGELEDPLEGLDDCSRLRAGTLGTEPNMGFLAIDELAVIADGREVTVPLLPSSNPSLDFYSYGVDLAAKGMSPRFGKPYGMRGGGGPFAAQFEVDNIILPEDLTSNLSTLVRLDPADLTLRWQGTGDAPLQVRFWFRQQLAGTSLPEEVYCELRDDGEHRFDPALFAGIDASFVSVTLTRENRAAHTADGKTLVTTASVANNHELAWGSGCDGSAVMAACEQAADHILDVYAECGGAFTPSREELCPDSLLEACGTCEAHFECQAATYECGPSGLVVNYRACPCP